MKVAVAISGGIDSAVSAYILKERGYQIIGITLELFDSQKENINRAKEIAEKLKIEHIILDLKDVFNETIISNFINSYSEGKTPNPCALCNKEIKFGKALEYMIKNFNIKKFATGHYIRIEKYKGYFLIKKAKDKGKDQSYFLALINSEIIPYLIFPLGELYKEKVIELGKKIFGFFEYEESQDICFLKNKSLKKFLSLYLPEKEGPVIYKDKVVGTHPGIHWFTIGQRKGLNLPLGKPLYIIKLDAKENKIILGEKEELFSDGLILETLNSHLPLNLWDNPFAQIRYRTSLAKVKDLIKKEEKYTVLFETPVKGVTPGQVCAFYENDFLLGGGIIKSPI